MAEIVLTGQEVTIRATAGDAVAHGLTFPGLDHDLPGGWRAHIRRRAASPEVAASWDISWQEDVVDDEGVVHPLVLVMSLPPGVLSAGVWRWDCESTELARTVASGWLVLDQEVSR